jgi:hypothetical protein
VLLGRYLVLVAGVENEVTDSNILNLIYRRKGMVWF